MDGGSEELSPGIAREFTGHPPAILIHSLLKQKNLPTTSFMHWRRPRLLCPPARDLSCSRRRPNLQVGWPQRLDGRMASARMDSLSPAPVAQSPWTVLCSRAVVARSPNRVLYDGTVTSLEQLNKSSKFQAQTARLRVCPVPRTRKVLQDVQNTTPADTPCVTVPLPSFVQVSQLPLNQKKLLGAGFHQSEILQLGQWETP